MAAAGARAGLGLGAVTCFVAAAFGALLLRRRGAPGPAAATAPAPPADTYHAAAVGTAPAPAVPSH